MRPRACTVVVCAAILSIAALADQVQVWEASGQYRTTQDGWLYVQSARTFKVQAMNGQALGTINGISVDPQVPPIQGTVIIYVVRNPAEVGGLLHEPGAVDVRQIDLTHRVSNGVLAELNITGDLAVTGPIRARATDGPLTIGHDVLNDIEMTDILD
jgi:hypothetical protein